MTSGTIFFHDYLRSFPSINKNLQSFLRDLAEKPKSMHPFAHIVVLGEAFRLITRQKASIPRNSGSDCAEVAPSVRDISIATHPAGEISQLLFGFITRAPQRSPAEERNRFKGIVLSLKPCSVA